MSQKKSVFCLITKRIITRSTKHCFQCQYKDCIFQYGPDRTHDIFIVKHGIL